MFNKRETKELSLVHFTCIVVSLTLPQNAFYVFLETKINENCICVKVLVLHMLSLVQIFAFGV